MQQPEAIVFYQVCVICLPQIFMQPPYNIFLLKNHLKYAHRYPGTHQSQAGMT